MELSVLRELSMSKSDEPTTGFVSNTELNRFLNQGLKLIYNTIAQRFENYFIVRGSDGTSFTTFTTADVSIATDQITVGRRFNTGDPVLFKTTGTAPGGLSTATTYYAIQVSS